MTSGVRRGTSCLGRLSMLTLLLLFCFTLAAQQALEDPLAVQIACESLGVALPCLDGEQLQLLEMALDKTYMRDPHKFIAKSQARTEPPPPKHVSKKDGFSIHVHPAFPNYELRVKSPQLDLDSVTQHSGYIDILDEDKHFFFWLWESRSDPKNDPVILWTNGGPGCSSVLGEFFELGPAFVDMNLSTHYNPYAWNSQATIIFLDQPVNVGYSYSSERVSESQMAGEDVYAFLEVLFDAMPQYAGLPFHISGESYGGKYLPAIGKAILNHPERTFNLQSALIGNPITDPAIQAFSEVAMACGDGGYPSVLDEETCEELWDEVPYCEALLNMCYDTENNELVCAVARNYCAQLSEPYLKTGRNRLDISDLCYDNCYPEFGAIEKFMRLPEVIDAVGSDVDNFESCSSGVMDDFTWAQDQTRNEGPDVLDLLEAGVDVLFYEGDLDWVCSWPGVYRLVERLRYAEHAEFTHKPVRTWYVDGEAAGETKSAGHLSWMKIYDAGHMVPHDKGKQGLGMLLQWIQQRKFH